MVTVVQERIGMYQQALQIAKQTGDSSKQRRLDRGLRVSSRELAFNCREVVWWRWTCLSEAGSSSSLVIFTVL